MDSLRKDLVFACRNLRRSPGFVAVVVLTLALGVGANVAIYTVVDGMMLEALPYREASRVVRIWDTKPSQGWDRTSISSLNFADWRERSRSFEEMAIFQSASFNLSDEGGPERIIGASSSANLLRLLGREPALGRDFRAEEDEPGAAPVVVLGDRLWLRRFAGDPGVIGTTLRLDGVAHTIVGVMPPGFFFPGPSTEVWVPAAFPTDPESRGNRRYAAMGRLREGVTIEQAAAELAGIAADLEREFPDQNAGWSVEVKPAIQALLGDEIPQIFLILLLAVGFVAMIACANIASLMLSRAVVREREVSVRTVLGATRGQLLRQLLTETLVLALVGGALGILAGVPMTRLVLLTAPDDAPRLDNVAIDGSVLVYAAGLTLATALLFGLVPALQASKPDVHAALKDAARGSAGTPRHRLLRGLVAAEVALATALLALGVLSVRSVQSMLRSDPGFDVADLLTFRLDLPESKYPEAPERTAFFSRLLAELRALPGAGSVSAVQTLPLGGSNSWNAVTVEGIPLAAPDRREAVGYLQVHDQYFEALDVAVLRGRTLGPADVEPGARTVAVNQAFVDRYWPEGGEDPIGRRVHFGWENAEDRPWLTIVGVAANIRHSGLGDPPRPEIYVPYGESPGRSMSVVIETAAAPESLLPLVRDALARVDPDQPLYEGRTMREVIVDETAGLQAVAQIFGALAAGALALAAVGIYGVIAFTTSQRRHEIGIRRAVGAQPRDIVWFTLRQALVPVVLGLGAGLVLSIGLGRAMRAVLFGVAATDPRTYALALAGLLAVATLASLLPARRAVRVDPLAVLRHE